MTSSNLVSFGPDEAIDSGRILPLHALAKLVLLELAMVASVPLLSNGSLNLPPTLRPIDELECGRGIGELACRLNARDGIAHDPADEREDVEMLRSRVCWTVCPDSGLATEEHDRLRAWWLVRGLRRGLLAAKETMYEDILVAMLEDDCVGVRRSKRVVC
jgi:hypothetical protein